jgi:4-amino-4-deoxy-L-arabinose transferase-like glycosyltransferase
VTAGREALLVVVTCTVLYLTGIPRVPFYTRGEPREGLVVREMLQGARWLVPQRPDGEPARKPPLYYWLAAPSLSLLPDRPELALRLPSIVLGSAAVLAVWATARALAGPGAGLPAALVLATTFEWTRAATSARVDMTLAAALTAVLAGWTLALLRGGGWPLVAAAGAALGTLAKGPVALVLPALTVAMLAVVARRTGAPRRLRPVTVLALAAVAGGLWYAVALLQGGQVFAGVVARENWLRFLDAEDHAHGVGYLPLLGLVGLLPWTPLLPLAVAPFSRTVPAPALRFAACWIATVLAFFSLAAAKRSVYLLPLFPAVALLLGAGVAAPPTDRLRRAARAGAAAYAPALLVLAALAAAFAAGRDPTSAIRPWLKTADAAGAVGLVAAAHAARPWLGLLAVASAVGAALAARAARRGDWRRLVVTVAATAVLWTTVFDSVLHPAIAEGRSPRSFLARVGHLLPAETPLYVRFPPDPALRFYAPRPLRAWSPATHADGGHLLLWEDEWLRWRDAAGQPLRVVAVSASRQPRRGHLALIVAPPGRMVPAPPTADQNG